MLCFWDSAKLARTLAVALCSSLQQRSSISKTLTAISSHFAVHAVNSIGFSSSHNPQRRVRRPSQVLIIDLPILKVAVPSLCWNPVQKDCATEVLASPDSSLLRITCKNQEKNLVRIVIDSVFHPRQLLTHFFCYAWTNQHPEIGFEAKENRGRQVEKAEKSQSNYSFLSFSPLNDV